ncbi:CRR6 family NdhI maturation factor [Merismopedia glauca]|uniref:DUF1817 domain-containing protein n=1 Tax=Merismopedia glauca CCAP 1448/3 TaxID=1296344 RepID=A0A2T1BXP8_9CYAN|nr:CRR6 family NdhI maturation factor [Merismopedia glauca]PSB00704.1 DUF1817 domain-containing protein [Merismopedia glauca CCAP 1448/3]
MTLKIIISAESIQNLDLVPVKQIVEKWQESGELTAHHQHIQLQIDYIRDPDDPRELSEVPEVRLWFIRLDSYYPWFPFLLDWKSGELSRYAAMLVPHQFSHREGIQYNPEALEIFVMQKTFVLMDWMKGNEIETISTVKYMAQMFGYELDDGFFSLI